MASAAPPTSSGKGTSLATARKQARALESMQTFLSSTTDASSPIQPTDIQLLTTSILSNAERQTIILQYQEQLIEGCPTRIDLKKALLYLSTSSWGQILEERHIVHKCAYPPCPNPSPIAPQAAGKVGKFRINLGSQKVTATDDIDLGEAGHSYHDLKHFFCSKQCYARSEWVLRWILSEKEIGFAPATSTKGAASSSKWKNATLDPKAYQALELLEDIEAQQGFDLLKAETASFGPDEIPLISAESVVRPIDALSKIDMAKDTSKMLDKLPVIERTNPPTASLTNAPATSATSRLKAPTPAKPSPLRSKWPAPSRTTFDVDVPNNLGRKFAPAQSNMPSVTDAEQDDENDIDLREMEMTKILRFASLATGSRPRRKNTTITLTTAKSGTGDESNSTRTPQEEEEEDEAWEQDLTPQQAAEQREMRRIMDLALGVREEQRDLGLLD